MATLRFTLTLDLGNAVMQSADDVAHVLGILSRGLPDVWDMGGATLRDDDGNPVGAWQVAPAPVARQPIRSHANPILANFRRFMSGEYGTSSAENAALWLYLMDCSPAEYARRGFPIPTSQRELADAQRVLSRIAALGGL